jgi:DNA (cytosine-5)-methyltransferase 1
MGRQDYETETMIACSVSDSLTVGANQTTGFATDVVAHTLKAEGFDAGEDGTGRGTPLVPVAFRTTGNDGVYETGDIVHALTTATDPNAHVLAFSCKDHGADAQDGVAPTMRAMGHADSHANAGGQLAVAFDLRGREGGAIPEGPHETANIRAASGGSSRSYVAQQAWAINSHAGAADGDQTNRSHANGGPVGLGIQEGAAYALRSRRTQAVGTAWAVRRLTPTECARLQGFPDDWARIPWRGRPASECPDGPMYKAYGNSMACNVMRWIGRRIEMVRALADKREAAE